jgi:Cell Wall Hydrolase
MGATMVGLSARRPWLPVLLLAALASAAATAAIVRPATAGQPWLQRGNPMAAHREFARRAGLRPCAAADLDCRAFTGTLAWRPDERKPLLSSKALRRLALLRGLNGGQRERALRCLAFVAWAEARGDGVAGMRAVVAAVMNRSRSPAYPAHPCEIIGQAGAFEPVGKDGYRATALALRRRALAPFPRPPNMLDAAALQMARLLVWNLARRAEHPDPTGGATHFLAPEVLRARGQPLPRWARTYERTARVGGHDFFRAPMQLAQEP